MLRVLLQLDKSPGGKHAQMVQCASYNFLAWLVAQHLYKQGREMGSVGRLSIVLTCALSRFSRWQTFHLWKVNVGRGSCRVHLCAMQEKAKIAPKGGDQRQEWLSRVECARVWKAQHHIYATCPKKSRASSVTTGFSQRRRASSASCSCQNSASLTAPSVIHGMKHAGR